MSVHHDDSGAAPRRPRLGLTLLLAVGAVVGLAAVAMSAYGGSGPSSGEGNGQSGKAKGGHAKFRECMRAEGVKISPDGPPAESEKTAEMRRAFRKCGQRMRRGRRGGPAGFREFHECMRAEGVEPSPDGPPAESEKTDEMRQAFEKCGNLIPEHIRERMGGGPDHMGGGPDHMGGGPESGGPPGWS